MGVICRNSPTTKKEKKCKYLEKFGRGYLSEQSRQKKVKKCQFFKSLGRVYLSEQSHQKKGEKSLGRGYLSGQSLKKKKKKTGEKVSILEKFRKRLFVGT